MNEKRMKTERFEDIEAWQFAQELTCKVNARKKTLNGELRTCERLQKKGATL